MIEKNQNDALAWSVYWAQNKLHSCVASNSDDDQKVLYKIWANLAQKLDESGKVLDLATGNGAVPVALLEAKPDLNITAVDQADIDPALYVKDHPELSNVMFLSNVDINAMEHDGVMFDAMTSQFGIEYAGLKDAAEAALKFLKPAGQFVFVTHHAESELIKSSEAKLLEAKHLLIEGGVIDTLLSVLRSEVSFERLEDLGREFIESDHVKTQSISGQVFAGIEQIATQLSSNPESARTMGATLKLRLKGEHDRLQQMQDSAQTLKDVTECCSNLNDQGFTVSAPEPIYVDQDKQEYLIAWCIRGHRNS